MKNQSDSIQDKRINMLSMDRKVTFAHIIALLIHGGGLIWYISGIAHDVSLNTKARVEVANIIMKVEMHDEFIKQNEGVAKEVAVINERTKHMASAIQEIKLGISKN